MNDVIKKELAAFGGKAVIPSGFTHPSWPVITKEYEDAIIRQMHQSMSIYNRSGIIEEFEDKFAALHDARYALLQNSGTNAIWSMFVGAGLEAGDEVLCPTYTFFATNTPLLSSGLVPVFCDADENGGISIADIKKRVTEKTKAIIVTHMWGYPCDMNAIVAFAKEHELLLFEDCSHAHLARYKGKRVGTFGDAAAWSLQGQKNITGGEGGIVVTNSADLYYRANLQGHYNKRCRQEIPEDHELYRFAVTGMGLKLRSHPLAIAFANVQLSKHDEYQAMRTTCAEQYAALLEKYDFIELLDTEGNEPSWYGFIFKYNAQLTGISREDFVALLHAEGLAEVDIPGSTGPNHRLPIFKEPHALFPQFYAAGQQFNTEESFPGADAFCVAIVKLPTWAYEEHEAVLEYYLKGLKKVSDYVATAR
jgi:dTDP-4-amino-4,6-dideoxygalactose transaminase